MIVRNIGCLKIKMGGLWIHSTARRNEHRKTDFKEEFREKFRTIVPFSTCKIGLATGVIMNSNKKTRPHQTKISYFTRVSVKTFLFLFSSRPPCNICKNQALDPYLPVVILFTLSLQICIQMGRYKKTAAPSSSFTTSCVCVIHSELVTRHSLSLPLPSFTFMYICKCMKEDAKQKSTQKRLKTPVILITQEIV